MNSPSATGGIPTPPIFEEMGDINGALKNVLLLQAQYARKAEGITRQMRDVACESLAHEIQRYIAARISTASETLTFDDGLEFAAEICDRRATIPDDANRCETATVLAKRIRDKKGQATRSAIAESFPKSPAASTNRPENGEASKNGLRQSSDKHGEPSELVIGAMADCLLKNHNQVTREEIVAAWRVAQPTASAMGEPVAWRYVKKDTGHETMSNQPPDRVLFAGDYVITPLYVHGERSKP